VNLHVSRFNHRGDNDPKPVEITWENLVKDLTRFRIRKNKDGELWSPVRYIKGGSRNAKDVLDVYLLVIDYDEGDDPALIRTRFDELGLEYVIHSTFHNMIEKQTKNKLKPAVTRWRAIFPLQRPMLGHGWNKEYERLVEYLSPGIWDPSCKDPSRLFWLPCAPSDENTFAEYITVNLLDPSSAPALPEREKRPVDGLKVVENDVKKAQNALSHISPDGDYFLWLRVGMALKVGFGEAGKTIWDEWSQTGEQYDADEIENKWETFDDEPGEQSVTMASVYRMAIDAGWEPPRHLPPADDAPPRTDEDVPYMGPQAVPDLKPSITPIPDADSWRRELTYCTDKSGNIKKERTAGNLALLMAHDEKWTGCVTYDELAHCVRWSKSPLSINGMPSPSGRLKDEHYTWIQVAARKAWDVQWSRPAVIEAVSLAACSKSVHPVKDYLEGLKWDGVSRLDDWLVKYMGSDGQTAPIGRWWMISAVARAYRPGCQVDHLLVLEGKQGIGKSTAIRILGGAWYSGNLGKLTTVDGAQSLLGKWIVEIGELDALKGAASTRVKDFITLTCDDYRPSYGRNNVHRPRQCVFCGSTNEDEYLHDPTGSRRYWPVKVRKIDREGLDADRDQLWAQARDAYMDGARWWPEGEEETAMLRQAAEDRFTADPWEEEIRGWLKSQTGTFSANDALEYLGLDRCKWNTREGMRVTAIFKRLGCLGKHLRSGNVWSRG